VETEQARYRQEQEQTRRESTRREITVQGIRTVLFVIGAVLSVPGNAVTC